MKSTEYHLSVVLTFDDSCRSHLKNVAPILKRRGFNATFFITRFSDGWRAEHEKHLLTAGEIRQLSEMGFEIGNHTFSHANLKQLSDSECETEILALKHFLDDTGIPAAESFAYPGGQFADNAAPILRRLGFTYARTTEKRAWNPLEDDPMEIPAIPIQHEDEQFFHQAVALSAPEHPVVLVFHGVPDPVHEHVSTPPEIFARYMEYLYENNYRVIALNEYFEARFR